MWKFVPLSFQGDVLSDLNSLREDNEVGNRLHYILSEFYVCQNELSQ
jgi:hypothetical protein